MCSVLADAAVADVARRPAKRGWRRAKKVAWLIAGTLAVAFVSWLIALSDRAAAKARCIDHLKELGLALRQYESENGHFPAAAIAGSDGKALLSWRVALLPYLGRRDLYDEFRRDEAWDSPHNLALVARMPEAFACPSEPDSKRGWTHYQVVVGPKAGLGVVGTLFEPTRGVDIREVTDGASNTIMVAEGAGLVPWTKPDELKFQQDGPTPIFGSRHRDVFNVLFADGSVRPLRFTIRLETLRAILTRDGGEVGGG